MDDAATRFISAALTMYDIMEKRVTLVEQLKKNRQPFSDMDVVYLASPTVESAKKICGDFESRAKAKYGTVHIIFTESVCDTVDLCILNKCHTMLIIIIGLTRSIRSDSSEWIACQQGEDIQGDLLGLSRG